MEAEVSSAAMGGGTTPLSGRNQMGDVPSLHIVDKNDKPQYEWLKVSHQGSVAGSICQWCVQAGKETKLGWKVRENATAKQTEWDAVLNPTDAELAEHAASAAHKEATQLRRTLHGERADPGTGQGSLATLAEQAHKDQREGATPKVPQPEGVGSIPVAAHPVKAQPEKQNKIRDWDEILKADTILRPATISSWLQQYPWLAYAKGKGLYCSLCVQSWKVGRLGLRKYQEIVESSRMDLPNNYSEIVRVLGKESVHVIAYYKGNKRSHVAEHNSSKMHRRAVQGTKNATEEVRDSGHLDKTRHSAIFREAFLGAYFLAKSGLSINHAKLLGVQSMWRRRGKDMEEQDILPYHNIQAFRDFVVLIHEILDERVTGAGADGQDGDRDAKRQGGEVAGAAAAHGHASTSSTPGDVVNAVPARGKDDPVEVKTALRNRIKDDLLHGLVDIKKHGPPIGSADCERLILEAVSRHLKKNKDRRFITKFASKTKKRRASTIIDVSTPTPPLKLHKNEVPPAPANLGFGASTSTVQPQQIDIDSSAAAAPRVPNASSLPALTTVQAHPPAAPPS